MAPEVAVGKPYNSSVDVYSFSIIVWQILKGDVPFQGDFLSVASDHTLSNCICKGMGRKAFMERVVAGGERPKIGRGWPRKFSALLQRCWSEDKVYD